MWMIEALFGITRNAHFKPHTLCNTAVHELGLRDYLLTALFHRILVQKCIVTAPVSWICMVRMWFWVEPCLVNYFFLLMIDDADQKSTTKSKTFTVLELSEVTRSIELQRCYMKIDFQYLMGRINWHFEVSYDSTYWSSRILPLFFLNMHFRSWCLGWTSVTFHPFNCFMFMAVVEYLVQMVRMVFILFLPTILILMLKFRLTAVGEKTQLLFINPGLWWTSCLVLGNNLLLFNVDENCLFAKILINLG